MFFPEELAHSTVANTVVVNQAAPKSLVRLDTTQLRARAWRITLQRLMRDDQFSPNVPGDISGSLQEFPGAAYSYAAGFQLTPQFPPRRSNPVYAPVGGIVKLEVGWGLGGGNPARLVADYPAMGGSIVVVGSHVDVSVALFTGQFVAPFPVATATITPVEGLAAADGGELSLIDRIPVRPLDIVPAHPTWGGAAYVPEFARRVRVQLLVDDTFSPFVNTDSVPLTGAPPAVMTWFDDNGATGAGDVGSWVQGLISPTIYADPTWHPVPAAATMLAVRGSPTFNNTAIVEWRISP